MRPSLPAAALLSVLLLGGCATHSRKGAETPAAAAAPAAEAAEDPKTSRAALAKALDENFNDPRFLNAHFGVLVQSLESGEVLYERNADRLFIPASNEKILTTAASLLTLGPDFRFETTLRHTGAVKDGVLKGDLIVVGNGDPTLYTRFHKDSRDVFRGWAKALKDQGITRVEGRIIGDDNAWEDSHTGSGWPGDEVVPWYYAEFGPLSLNENYVDLTITPPATLDGEVVITPNLPSAYYTLVNNVKVVADGESYISLDRRPFSNEILVGGQVKAGSKPIEETPTITNPTAFYVTVLDEVLEQEGISIDGLPQDCDVIEDWSVDAAALPVLASHQSPPLSEILSGLMKRSQNMYAETMVYALGWKTSGKGTFSAGRKAVQEALKPLGIEPGSFNFSDGSGLSRYNYVSPRIIGKIYSGMLQTDKAEVWRNCQAIAGVDGTLRSRMKGTKAENNVRGKTGTVFAVRSLSGYVTTAAGERLVFSFLLNGHTQSNAATNEVLDRGAVLLANFEGAVPAAQ